MISYRDYSDKKLREAVLKLKENPKMSDFALIEQAESELRRRGKDPKNSAYGKDVLGSLVKSMIATQKDILS